MVRRMYIAMPDKKKRRHRSGKAAFY